MRVGIASRLLWNYSIRDCIDIASDLGYDGIEIWAEHLGLRSESVNLLRAKLQSTRLDVIVHAPFYDLNLTSINEAVRKLSLSQVISSITLADSLGARKLTVHPGHLSSKRTCSEEFWPMQFDAFAKIAEVAGKYGILVGIECMEKRAREFITRPKDAMRIINHVTSNKSVLGITLDLAHLRTVGEPTVIVHEAERIFHVHLSDSDTQNVHLPLGHGTYNLLPVLRELKGKYSDIIIIEGYSPGNELATVRANKVQIDALLAEVG